jgi:hypothetical protein
MGSISFADNHDQNYRGDVALDTLSRCYANGNGFHSFQANGLTLDQITTMTGITEEIVLLSWLIVLLRTREGGQICFDWAYRDPTNGPAHEPVRRRLLMDEVMTGLHNTVGQTAAAISCHVNPAPLSRCALGSNPISLLLSTCSLSPTLEEIQDEVSAQSTQNTTWLIVLNTGRVTSCAARG